MTLDGDLGLKQLIERAKDFRWTIWDDAFYCSACAQVRCGACKKPNPFALLWHVEAGSICQACQPEFERGRANAEAGQPPAEETADDYMTGYLVGKPKEKSDD